MTTKQPEARVAARCSAKLKRQIESAERKTGQKESELVRIALELFFTAHKTPDQIMAAVVASRATRLAA